MIVTGLAGCNNHRFANASERNINIATRTVEIADDFLDARISAEIARERMEALAPIEYGGVDDLANSGLSANVGLLQTIVRFPSQDATEHWDNVLERRNELAVGLGMRRR